MTSEMRFIAPMMLSLMLAHSAWSAEVKVTAVAHLDVNPPLSQSDDESTNVSGAACHQDGDVIASCLLVGDEVRYARIFSVVGNELKVGNRVFLLPKQDAAGKTFKETDAEAVSYYDGSYYIAGSHGLNKSGDKQSSRYFLYAVPAEAVEKRTGDVGSKNNVSDEVKRSSAIEKLLDSEPFKSFNAVTPENGGTNIEGMAVSDGRIYLGFRGPILNHEALIAETSLRSGPGDARESLKVHHLSLGEGQGIRDLAAFQNGLLVLSGPQDRNGGEAGVVFWKPDDTWRKLATLEPRGNTEQQPEALTVLSTTADQVRVLVFDDGPIDGAPRIYEIPLK